MCSVLFFILSVLNVACCWLFCSCLFLILFEKDLSLFLFNKRLLHLHPVSFHLATSTLKVEPFVYLLI